MQNSIDASATQLEERFRLRRTIGTWGLLLFVIVLIGGSLSWMQWAAQRGLTLGYPPPSVHMTIQGGILRLQQQSNFSAAATGRDLTYTWDFGDQGSDSYASGQQVSHAYSSNGSYTVRITVIDGMGQTSSDTASVQVLPAPPVANFNFFVSNYYYGEVYFDASSSTADSSTSIASYNWNFGDGNASSTPYPQTNYTYYYTGTYTVSLTVTDATGQQSDAVTATITIS